MKQPGKVFSRRGVLAVGLALLASIATVVAQRTVPRTTAKAAAAQRTAATREFSDRPDVVPCWTQADPPRALPRLRRIPILIATAEASYHAAYDHCTSKYLTQAGVTHTFLRLEDAGIQGNGHMMMLEKNSVQIAARLQKWIAEHVK